MKTANEVEHGASEAIDCRNGAVRGVLEALEYGVGLERLAQRLDTCMADGTASETETTRSDPPASDANAFDGRRRWHHVSCVRRT